MTFASDAYAEGICNTAAGSEIEVFVDTVDETLSLLNQLAASVEHSKEDADAIQTIYMRWHDLREEIVSIEEDNDEATVFAEED